MLTEQLRQVVARMEHLSEQDQARLAALIAAELDEDARWQATMDDPHDLVLDKLIAEAKEEVARGEARDFDESL